MNFWDKYIIPGKTPAFIFYVRSIMRRLTPGWILRRRRKRLLQNWESRPDADYIRWRRDIYCPDFQADNLPEEESVKIRDIGVRRFQSRYVFDAQKTLLYFPPGESGLFKDGDIWENPDYPTLMKARRLNGKNETNAVILNLDSIRHWLRPKDCVPFDRKIPKLFFRGDIYNKPLRIRFFEEWAGNAMFDLGDTNRSHPSKWQSEFVSIPEQLNYQFILALEGYDMASSLQWIMASECVPVMPRPTVEGWLMHSQLIPGKHYIEIAADFSDVGEKIEYYINHPAEAEYISRESKKWAEQFLDKRREHLISLLVVDKYLTNCKRK